MPAARLFMLAKPKISKSALPAIFVRRCLLAKRKRWWHKSPRLMSPSPTPKRKRCCWSITTSSSISRVTTCCCVTTNRIPLFSSARIPIRVWRRIAAPNTPKASTLVLSPTVMPCGKRWRCYKKSSPSASAKTAFIATARVLACNTR